MGRVNFNVDSVALREIVEELDIDGKLQALEPKALQAGAEALLPYMQRRAPVRSGQLKKALAIGKRSRRRGRSGIEVGAFHADAPHAHLVEQGHGGPHPAPAHPFMEPAANEAEEAVTAAIMAVLTGGI